MYMLNFEANFGCKYHYTVS